MAAMRWVVWSLLVLLVGWAWLEVDAVRRDVGADLAAHQSAARGERHGGGPLDTMREGGDW